MRNKRVTDWVDKIVEKEHAKSRVKNCGRIPALNIVRERLFNRVMRFPKNTKITKGSKAEFMIDAMEYTDDLVDSFNNEWGQPHCCRDSQK